MSYKRVTKYHDINYCPHCGGETSAGSYTPYVYDGEEEVTCTECNISSYWSYGYFQIESEECFRGVYYYF